MFGTSPKAPSPKAPSPKAPSPKAPSPKALFGKKVCKGQDYYRLSMGDSRDNDAILSHQSMQLFLFLLFAPRPYWEQEVGKMIDGRFDQVRRIMDNLRSL